MLYLFLKAALSGLIIVAASEIARRSAAFGALVGSLPLVAILAMLWLWHDTGDSERIARYAQSTFWFVLPTLPMFLLFPALLRHQVGFWPSLLVSCLLTVTLYLVTAWALPKIGINF